MNYPIKTALLSVSDKTGIVALARTLLNAHVTLLSTGGTAELLKKEGLAVTDVSEYTQSPEMMDGRVKTLHPRIHGGLLARADNSGDAASMAAHQITAIDLLVVNLYPFEATIASDAGYATVIENIDIGGPAMIRAAAKNHQRVCVVTEPKDYALIAEAVSAGKAVDYATRQRLAATAYARTAHYDAVISGWFAKTLQLGSPERITLPMTLKQELRYGENPHQHAAFYQHNAGLGTIAAAEQLHGKALSFNNINDTDAAWRLVSEFEVPAIAIIKHANPCGVATAATLADAYSMALSSDPQSAYGGIIAANREFDVEAATALGSLFAEVIIAPSFSAGALEILTQKKNIRLLHTHDALAPKNAGLDVRTVTGGYLLQSPDDVVLHDDIIHASARTPSSQEIEDMVLAFTVAKHVKSNAIVLAKDGMVIGVGAGQMSRVDSVRVACEKATAAGLSTKGCALASDAFFPFDDNVHLAAQHGITSIIQPGGSIRDDEVIAAANQYNISLSFTGIRHFKH
jgi:phosphoribosylaminoimidazolecarboxamide formyltransferase / IMP cyclohydrolase